MQTIRTCLIIIIRIVWFIPELMITIRCRTKMNPLHYHRRDLYAAGALALLAAIVVLLNAVGAF